MIYEIILEENNKYFCRIFKTDIEKKEIPLAIFETTFAIETSICFRSLVGVCNAINANLVTPDKAKELLLPFNGPCGKNFRKKDGLELWGYLANIS
jgi:hypothetical protein